MSDAMSRYDVVVLNLHANGGSIEGRAVLQKLVYFEHGQINMKVEFAPHYYGPYSKHVAAALADLVSWDYVTEGQSKEKYAKYTYRLTEDGEIFMESALSEYQKTFEKIKDIVERCKELCGLDTRVITCAAKAHHIAEGTRVLEGKIREMGRSFGWNLSDGDVRDGMNLLEGLAPPRHGGG